jgi:APA family basic amino acid/polyamine antiporter
VVEPSPRRAWNKAKPQVAPWPLVAALGAIALATAFNAAGLRVGRRTAWVVVAAVLTVLVVVVAACFAIDPPPPPVAVVSVPHGASGYGHNVLVGVLAAAGMAFVSFVGFESITGLPISAPAMLSVLVVVCAVDLAAVAVTCAP